MSRAKREHIRHAAEGGDSGHWIQGAVKHPGALHKMLHVPTGEKIPEKKLDKALHSGNKLLRERAHFADVMKHSIHHKRGGRGG
jgi:hypothetical protein